MSCSLNLSEINKIGFVGFCLRKFKISTIGFLYILPNAKSLYMGIHYCDNFVNTSLTNLLAWPIFFCWFALNNNKLHYQSVEQNFHTIDLLNKMN
jgi:hypothetical protein